MDSSRENAMRKTRKKWDVFISHASEDKEVFVRPLALALCNLGVNAWYDEFSLRIGDSLSRSIDKGLAGSVYGIVVISPHFIMKPWPEYELRGLVARELDEDRVILPIWHGVTRDQVLHFSPSLADKVAINTAGLDAGDVAIQLLREVRSDLYVKHPRSELERIVNGEALRELQEEIERIRNELDAAQEELSEYRCPYCNAPLSTQIDVPLDPEEKDWDVRQFFECGFKRCGSLLEQPCPADPRFPKFTDYTLLFHHNPEEQFYKWQCFAQGNTDMARRIYISPGFGKTKKEAEHQLLKNYESIAARARA
jgi:hypothetical protein